MPASRPRIESGMVWCQMTPRKMPLIMSQPPARARNTIASGGLACVAGVALTALWLRDFWDYDARTDEHALAEQERRRASGEVIG